MTGTRSLRVATAVVAFALALAGCANWPQWGTGVAPEPTPQPPPVASAPPGSIPARDLLGRWGFASYHREGDRARTETAARGQCSNAYVIGAGPTGGVMMLGADSPDVKEFRIKGGPGGKNYIGPDGPAADPRDREVVFFDGRVLVLRWIDPEVAGRYGIGVYVRCGPRP